MIQKCRVVSPILLMLYVSGSLIQRRVINRDSIDVAGLGVYDTEAGDVGITYEQMQSIIESVLVESGYYDMSRNHSHVLPPYTPGGATNDHLHLARS